jgi:hypothetical protein
MVNGRLLQGEAAAAKDRRPDCRQCPATMRALRNWPVARLLQILVECRWFEFYENTRRIRFEF